MAKVLLDEASGCWLWQGWITANGYGQFTPFHGRKEYAHRWAYQHWVNLIPEGLQIDHLCRVRACVNPRHLEPVTQFENQRRAIEAANRCRRGHEYTETNTRLDKRGHRVCRACHAEKMRKFRSQP